MPRPVYSQREVWLKDARCRGMNPNLFFPMDADGRIKFKVDPQAVEACANCPVIEQCADWATRHEAYGYQGGMTETQRAQRRRKLNILLWEPQHNITTIKPAVRSLPAHIVHGTPSGYKMEIKRGFEACDACRAAHTAQAKASKAKVKLLKQEQEAERQARISARMAELEAERKANAEKRAAEKAKRAARAASR